MTLLATLAALALAQTPVWPGGGVGPGGPYMPGQVDDGGATFVHPVPTPIPNYWLPDSGWWQNIPPPQPMPHDGGMVFQVCVASDCNGGVSETRMLFNAQAIGVMPNALQAFAPLPSFVIFTNTHNATAIQHYVVTDVMIASGSGAIIEGQGPYCDGGSYGGTVLYGPFLGPLVEPLVTPMPTDSFANLCFLAGAAGADVRIGGYLTNFTPKTQ